MFDSDSTAHDFIALGECIVVLRNPSVWNAPNYAANRDEFLRRLRLSVFKSTLAAAVRLENFEAHENLKTHTIVPQDAARLEAIAQTVYSVLSHESEQATVILTDHVPPDALMKFADSVIPTFADHQQALLRDLITCLKAHLARPAIVMAWALGYDIVRWWVHSDTDRLTAFNAQSKSGQVVEYEDFFSLGERYVLDTCKNAQGALSGFSENTNHALVALLNDRNRFAHANFSEATIHRANAFVEKMVETVAGPPFKS